MWQRAKAVFVGAIEREEGVARGAYLDAACAGDGALRAEVDSLLAAHADQAMEDTVFGRAGVPGLGTGAQVGDWTVGEMLGQGGMGTVYRASDGVRKAAMKIAHGDLAWRFPVEQEILAALDLPQVCRFVEAGEGFLVMELVEGRRIDHHCGDLSPVARLEVFARLCDAVHSVHQQGVVHLDIKAQNVLVTENGVPKLIDFGIARRLPADAYETECALTPDSASPEQIRGERVGPATDVHALGLLFVRLLAGRHPYRRRSVPAVLRAIANGEPCLRGLCARGRVVAEAALHKVPGRRPSAAGLASAVRALAGV